MTYAATRSSADDRANRNENGLRRKLPSLTTARLYPCHVQRNASAGRFAERVLHGFDDAGADERVVIWIERKPGALWAVGRAVNPQHRSSAAPRRDDYVFEGYELEDALEAANNCLEDDLDVSEKDGRGEHVRPFTRDELLKPLERWFFNR
jgi:hypothetical protein